MNIWIINQDADVPEGHGPTRSYDLSVALADKGHQVTLILGNFSHVRRQHIQQPSNKVHQHSENGISIVRIPVIEYTKNNWRRFAAAVMFAARLLFTKLADDKPDVIIGSSPNPIAAYGAYLLAKKTKSKFFYEIRDLWPATLILLNNFSEYHPVTVLFKWIEKSLAKRADKIIAVLPGISEYLAEQYQIPADKVLYLPNFAKISQHSAPAEERIPDQKGTFHFFYCGSHNTANALDTLIDAAKILQEKGESRILITLMGTGADKNRLIERALQHQLSNIIFLEPVAKTQIHQYLKKADAGLILWQKSSLYRWGTSANKMFDYLNHKLPVIEAINSQYGMTEIAQCGITVPAEDPEAYANAMITLSKMTGEQRAQFGDQGFNFLRENHNISTLASRLESTCADEHL